MGRKDKAAAKAAGAALQQDLDTLIENEHGGEPVKGRKHTFDMTKAVKKEIDKKEKK